MWTPSPSPKIVGYFIYRNGKKIAKVDAFTFAYQDHNRKKGIHYNYAIRAFNAAGSKSAPINIIIKPSKKHRSGLFR